ncbi:MAG: NADPH-dependent FMN reductase [Actinomycetota bacterium]|nr:NADPH-dependent FMN reductase [Actinomycetota bacterium]
MSRILTVSGSPRQHSRSAKLLDHVAAELAISGHHLEHLRLLDLPADALLTGDAAHPQIMRARQRLERADGVVIATPVHQAAYTGLLKAWLDLLPQSGLEDKTVLPLATGGSMAHALALDYALRPVLQAMGARHVVQGYLVVDHFIETDGPDGVTTVTGEALPGLREVVDGFRRALAFDAVRLSA